MEGSRFESRVRQRIADVHRLSCRAIAARGGKNAMTERELMRRVRGRARRARRKTQRLRAMGFAVLAIMALAVFSSTAFDYVERKSIAMTPRSVYTFEMPPLPLVLAQASARPEQPGLLQLDEKFPARGNRELPEEPEIEEPEKVVVLDDLRAAPPKEIFLEAIFLGGSLDTEEDLPEIQLSRDFTHERWPDLFGDTNKSTPIPEPSTALLLSLGLGGMAALRRSRKARDRGNAALSSVSRTERTTG